MGNASTTVADIRGDAFGRHAVSFIPCNETVNFYHSGYYDKTHIFTKRVHLDTGEMYSAPSLGTYCLCDHHGNQRPESGGIEIIKIVKVALEVDGKDINFEHPVAYHGTKSTDDAISRWNNTGTYSLADQGARSYGNGVYLTPSFSLAFNYGYSCMQERRYGIVTQWRDI